MTEIEKLKDEMEFLLGQISVLEHEVSHMEGRESFLRDMLREERQVWREQELKYLDEIADLERQLKTY